jgi:hypothetical protein
VRAFSEEYRDGDRGEYQYQRIEFDPAPASARKRREISDLRVSRVDAYSDRERQSRAKGKPTLDRRAPHQSPLVDANSPRDYSHRPRESQRHDKAYPPARKANAIAPLSRIPVVSIRLVKVLT